LQSGSVTAALASVTPSITVGLGIGITGGGTLCRLTKTIDAVAGAQVTIAVDPGSYCAEVYDTGAVGAQQAAFSMFIVHP
jgi:hypothetical protein